MIRKIKFSVISEIKKRQTSKSRNNDIAISIPRRAVSNTRSRFIQNGKTFAV